MARPRKDSLDYIPLDVNIFSDLKIKKLNRKFGGNGMLVYLYLINEIYKTGFELEIDGDDQFEIYADDLRITIELFNSILDYCFEVKLFDKISYLEENILTSDGIKKRYNFIMNDRLRKRDERSEIVNLDKLRTNSGQTTDKLRTNDGLTPDTSATKEKKRKEKEKEIKEKEKEERKEEGENSVSAGSVVSNSQISIPCSDGEIQISEVDVSFLVQKFPDTDVPEQIPKLINWLRGSKNGVTTQNINNFIENWMERNKNGKSKTHIRSPNAATESANGNWLNEWFAIVDAGAVGN